MNWLLKLIFAAITQALSGAVEVLADFIDNIFKVMYDINVGLNLDKVTTYAANLGTAFVILFAIKKGIDIYVLKTSGDAEEDSLEMVTRISMAVATITCGNWLLNKLVEVAALVSSDLTSSITREKRSFSEIFQSVLTSIMASTTIQMFILVIFMVVVLVSFVLFILKAAKRGAEIVLFNLLLPIMACDLLTTNRERWNSFFTELMICVFGYIIQLFSFNIFMLLFAKVMQNALDMTSLIASIAWLMIVLSGPKWLQKFTYSSGVGGAAKGGARSVTHILPSVIRK